MGLIESDWDTCNAEDLRGIRKLEERCARAEARIVELEEVIAGLRAKMEILIYPPTAFKEYKAK